MIKYFGFKVTRSFILCVWLPGFSGINGKTKIDQEASKQSSLRLTNADIKKQ